MEARLPVDKVERIQASLALFQTKRTCTLTELQSLNGTLNFACKVIPPGRHFLQGMIELTRKVNKPHHHIKLSKGFFKDLTMWQQFIHTSNGAGFFLPTSWLDSDSLELHTDASGTLASIVGASGSICTVIRFDVPGCGGFTRLAEKSLKGGGSSA